MGSHLHRGGKRKEEKEKERERLRTSCTEEEKKKDEGKGEKWYEERMGGKWIKKLMQMASFECDVNWNCEVKVIEEKLQPYFTSDKYRPDVWLSKHLWQEKYPLLMVERKILT